MPGGNAFWNDHSSLSLVQASVLRAVLALCANAAGTQRLHSNHSAQGDAVCHQLKIVSNSPFAALARITKSTWQMAICFQADLSQVC